MLSYNAVETQFGALPRAPWSWGRRLPFLLPFPNREVTPEQPRMLQYPNNT